MNNADFVMRNEADVVGWLVVWLVGWTDQVAAW